MSGKEIKTTNNTKEKSNVNPLIKMMADKKRIVDAIRTGKDLSTLKDIRIVSPI